MSHTSTTDERTLSAFAYLLTWPTGLIALLVAGKDRPFARWHAAQAIGLGVAAFLFAIPALFLTPILFADELLDGRGPPWYVTMGGVGPFAALLALIVLILVVLCARAAATGRHLRLPVLARIADRCAKDRQT